MRASFSWCHYMSSSQGLLLSPGNQVRTHPVSFPSSYSLHPLSPPFPPLPLLLTTVTVSSCPGVGGRGKIQSCYRELGSVGTAAVAGGFLLLLSLARASSMYSPARVQLWSSLTPRLAGNSTNSGSSGQKRGGMGGEGRRYITVHIREGVGGR